LRAIKPKGLNGIVKLGYGHLCLREENLSFIINYIKLYLFSRRYFYTHGVRTILEPLLNHNKT